MATNEWIKDTVGTWTTAGNWSLGHVPIVGEDVLFDTHVGRVSAGGGWGSPNLKSLIITSNYTGRYIYFDTDFTVETFYCDGRPIDSTVVGPIYFDNTLHGGGLWETITITKSLYMSRGARGDWGKFVINPTVTEVRLDSYNNSTGFICVEAGANVTIIGKAEYLPIWYNHGTIYLADNMQGYGIGYAQWDNIGTINGGNGASLYIYNRSSSDENLVFGTINVPVILHSDVTGVIGDETINLMANTILPDDLTIENGAVAAGIPDNLILHHNADWILDVGGIMTVKDQCVLTEGTNPWSFGDLLIEDGGFYNGTAPQHDVFIFWTEDADSNIHYRKLINRRAPYTQTIHQFTTEDTWVADDHVPENSAHQVAWFSDGHIGFCFEDDTDDEYKMSIAPASAVQQQQNIFVSR